MVRISQFIRSACLLISISSLTLAMRGPQGIKKQTIGKCNTQCQREIEQTEQYIITLQNQHKAEQNKFLQRIMKLEREVQSGANLQTLNQRLNRFQYDLRGNISLLEHLINYDMRHLYDNLHHDVDLLKKDLSKRFHTATLELNKLKRDHDAHHNNHHDYHGHHEFTAMDLSRNISSRLNNLENGIIHQLQMDSHLWRSNFHVINNKFEIIRRNKNCKCHF